jgi:hypothetical protein
VPAPSLTTPRGKSGKGPDASYSPSQQLETPPKLTARVLGISPRARRGAALSAGSSEHALRSLLAGSRPRLQPGDEIELFGSCALVSKCVALLPTSL